MKDLDEVTKISSGSLVYHGIAYAYSLFKRINFQNLGIMHSGQLGDVIFGSYNATGKPIYNFSNGDGAFSKKLSHRLDFDSILKRSYDNYEQFCFYQRGFNGINDGLKGIQKFTETISPFYDVDVLEFALKIPLKHRSKQQIYKKWILKKHPEAADYIWEKTGEKISVPSISLQNKEITFKKLLNRFKFVKKGYNSVYNMNPIEYWLRTNNELKLFYESYFENNIDLVIDKDLKSDCFYLFNSGNAMEKTQVLSLLSAIKTIFTD